MAMASLAGAQVILRVNIGAPTTSGDGSSWPQAFKFVQDALAAAEPIAAGGQDVQVWIAAGQYTPDQAKASPLGSKDQSASLTIPAQVSLYGGFAGSEANLAERDPDANITILSGDLNHDDDPDALPFFDPNRVENSFHVFTVAADAPGARIDGFQISGGRGGELEGGGAILNTGTLVIERCLITRNTGIGGGAISNTGTLTVLGGAFTMNSSLGRGTSVLALGPSTTLVGCDFFFEISFFGGAAVEGDVVAANCRFELNTALSFKTNQPNAGAFRGSGRLIGCAFLLNIGGPKESIGGAVLCDTGDLEVTNCTFFRNKAETGAALVFTSPGSLTLSNSLFWENDSLAPGGPRQDEQVSVIDGLAQINHCFIQGLTGSLGGVGNIGGDPSNEPRFLDWTGPDGEPLTADDNVRLSPGSPCIDAGSSSLLPPDFLDLDDDGNTVEPWPIDLDGLPRRVNDLSTPDTGAGPAPVVDMGAYEFQGGASVWTNPAGGNYFSSANWAPGSPPDTDNDLEFDLPATYGVSLPQPASCGRVIVGGGSVALNLGGNTLTAGPVPGDALTIGPWNHAAATLAVNSGTLVAARCLIAPDGTLQGTGTLAGAVRNSGTISPAGPGTGTLTIAGSLQMHTARAGEDDRAGILQMDVAGDQPGQFDRLIVNGTAALSGGLFVRDAPGFVPPPEMAVELVHVSGGADTGRFDVAFLPGLKDGRFYKVDYPESGGSVMLSVLELGGGSGFGSKDGSVSHLVTAIAVGLLNDDDLPDLAVTTSDGFVVLLFNGGNGPGGWNGFSSQIQFSSGGLEPAGIVIADFDPAENNGNDLAVSNAGSNTVVIFSRPAGPAWSPVATLPVGSRPMGLAAADFDGNGSIDLAVANFLSNSVSVRTNSSSASISFVTQPNVQTGDGPVDVDPWDPDNPKDPRSLAVANFGSSTVTFHPGNGNGSFGALTSLGVGNLPVQILARDLNLDGRTDLLTVNRAGNSVSVLMRTAAGAFNAAVDVPVGRDPSSITVLDVDDDGDADIALAAEDPPGTRVVQVLRNNSFPGDFTVALSAPISVQATRPPSFVDHADFDVDGLDDILAISADGAEAADNITVRLNRWRECFADFDRNTWVNGDDIEQFWSAFFEGDPAADVDGDHLLSTDDFDLFTSHFVAGC